MAYKPSIPKGTRDFTPEILNKRNFIFKVIENVFQLYGYQPIETPAMEHLTTLLGKYGDEGDKLLYKVLNTGDFRSKLTDEEWMKKDSDKLSVQLCDRGLRYDLTVPFARFIVQHRNEITFPFRRYQIQPVWRADRPQKGRYREFYQCDVDVIGSDSLLNELEQIEIIKEVFKRLNIAIYIKVNNRKILAGIIDTIGEGDMLTTITTSIDKLEKVGWETVRNEMLNKGIGNTVTDKLEPILFLKGSPLEKIETLKSIIGQSSVGNKGLDEMETLFNLLAYAEIKENVEFDLTLARGLDYYTGIIIEVLAKDIDIGSICGGGRYDDLASIFGLDNVSGIGISFGADRIYDVMDKLDLFPDKGLNITQLLFANLGEEEVKYILSILPQVRNAGIVTELYPDRVRLKKQLNYANNNAIPFVALIGEDELNSGKITLKNMSTGIQKQLSVKDLIREIS